MKNAFSITCPVCFDEFTTFLNLAGHMVLKKGRPNTGEHFEWLTMFVDPDFRRVAWGNDKNVGKALEAIWRNNNGQWPQL